MGAEYTTTIHPHVFQNVFELVIDNEGNQEIVFYSRVNTYISNITIYKKMAEIEEEKTDKEF